MSDAMDALRSDRLALTRLVELHLPDAVYRVWMGGPNTLTTTDGRQWLPIGGLGEISAIDEDDGASPNAFSIGLRRAADGVEIDPAAFAAAVNLERRTDVYGRDVTIYAQVLHLDTLAPVDAPVVEMAGIMSHVVTQRESTAATAITVHCESLWTEGRKPAFGFYTDADQQARYPGDRSLEFVAANASRELVWPKD